MEKNTIKNYGIILLCILIPVTIFLYRVIIPSVESEYNEEYANPYESTKTVPSKEETPVKKSEPKVKEKPASSFSKYITQDEMTALNNALYKIDSEKTNDPQRVASIFLSSMGYPENLIGVEYHEENGSNFEGDMQAGMFIPSTGKLSVSSKFAKFGDFHVLIGIIRHELDHFDKFAKLCKTIGVDNFSKMYNEDINREFWQNAISYADTTGFDKKKYLKAAHAMNEYTDITSFYQVFVEKSNDVRNPFELTAYAFSDYVDNHYKIKQGQETNVKKVAKVFNQVDWQIYKIASKNKYLARSRSAIFDYYYLRALMKYDPSLNAAYQNAVKNGNILSFWEQCQKAGEGLRTNVLSVNETNNLIKILNSMNLAMNEEITEKQVNTILQLKYIILKDAARNSKYANYKGNLVILLSINVSDYLDFLDHSSTDNSVMKLKLLASKYWLSNIRVQKEGGGFYDFIKNDSPSSIERKIKSQKLYKEKQQASGKSDDKFFEDFIMKNQIFP